MKYFFVMCSLCLSLQLVFTGSVYSQSNYPDYQNVYVNDFAEILSASQEATIRNELTKLRTDTGVEATVVTVESYAAYGTNDDSFEAFATNLFNDWGIGDRELNNGVLLLLALEERSVRIETGRGWENQLQSETETIIDSEILPKLRDDQMAEGMIIGTNAIANAVRIELGFTATQLPQGAIAPPTNSWKQTLTTLAISLFSVLGIGAAGGATYKFARPPRCEHCDRVLRKLGEVQDDAFLNAGQQTEERINAANYNVWVCDHDDYVSVKKRNKMFSMHQACPVCEFTTVTEQSKILQRATTESTGQQLVTKNCNHCDYQQSYEVVLPKVSISSTNDSLSFGSSSSSSFGDGSSGGGGSSGSW
ncbi:MAG: hypothetical protein ACI85U_002473 [Candidatus Promineifilaceae bacterium]|jgi:uncharacterized protein